MATVTIEQAYALARQAGATHDEAVILAAIAGGESGYNSHAHNPNAGTGDNSYGLWQINMLGQMGADRRKSFGLTSNEQLFDPLINAKAAVAILRSQGFKAWTIYRNGSYKKYLAQAQQAGAKVGDNYTNIAVQARVTGQALGAAGQTSSVIGGDVRGNYPTGGSTAGSTLPPNATPQQIEAYIRDEYPNMAGYLSVPEIRDILIQAARDEASGSPWSDTKLRNRIQSTEWWRTHSSSSREALFLQETDPASYESLVKTEMAAIAPQLEQLGLDIDPRFVAEAQIKYGWTPQQLNKYLATELEKRAPIEGLTEGSTVDVTADDLMTMARVDYLVPMARADVERWAIDIFAGRKTVDQYENYLQSIANGRFPQLTSMGVTPGQYLAPVRNVIAEQLEISPAEIDFLDKRWSGVLEIPDADGRFRPPTLSEAQKWAREQDAYRYTKGAREEAAAFAELITTTFGAV